MTPKEETAADEAKIMVVDDNPENLELLGDMLRQRGYHVRAFPRGRLALISAAQAPPDLILLDVNMPEMSGYEVCERIKAIEASPGIPVLFMSALNQTEDKIKGFQAGGVDYISKPFQFEEVHARVETHLRLRRALLAEKKLLDLTLNGSIRMLTDLIQANSPELAVRSRAIRDCVVWMTQRMAVAEAWQYDLAATLSLIGCVTLPEQIFKLGYAGKALSVEEEAMFKAHPESAKRLLTNIPRLEAIAEMIRLQQIPDVEEPSLSPEMRLGAHMLHLAVELDRRIYRGIPFQTALQELKATHGRFQPAMLAVLEKYLPASTAFHRQTLPIKRLSAGMTLDEDLASKRAGILVLRKGTLLSETWIERLANFAKLDDIEEPIPVLVPGPARIPEFRMPLRTNEVMPAGKR
jgi:putative two-component system response regulator